MLDHGKGRRRSKSGKGGKDSNTSRKKRRRKAVPQSSSHVSVASSALGRKKRKLRANVPSGRMGGSAAPAAGSVGGARSTIMRQQGGLPAEPYRFMSINQLSHEDLRCSMFVPMRGPSPSTIRNATGGARSPKTARAQGRVPSGDGFLTVSSCGDCSVDEVQRLLRDREALVRPYLGSVKASCSENPSAALPSGRVQTIVPDNVLERIVDIDRNLLAAFYSMASHHTCVCRRLCHIVHCREVREAGTSMSSSEMSVGNGGCVTAQRTVLFPIHSSLVAHYVNTAECSSLLQIWQDVRARLKSFEMAGDSISIDQTATIYSSMSEKAQSQLHSLDETELTAIQVLVGTKMGLKPCKSPIRIS